MRKSVRYALRFLAVMAVVASLSAFFAPSTIDHSPYRSALSSWPMTSTLAQGSCTTKCGTNHTCVDSGTQQSVCVMQVTCRTIQC